MHERKLKNTARESASPAIRTTVGGKNTARSRHDDERARKAETEEDGVAFCIVVSARSVLRPFLV